MSFEDRDTWDQALQELRASIESAADAWKAKEFADVAAARARSEAREMRVELVEALQDLEYTRELLADARKEVRELTSELDKATRAAAISEPPSYTQDLLELLGAAKDLVESAVTPEKPLGEEFLLTEDTPEPELSEGQYLRQMDCKDRLPILQKAGSGSGWLWSGEVEIGYPPVENGEPWDSIRRLAYGDAPILRRESL